MATAPQKYDVAIIGAGVNGAGIARDAAMRGLRVIVLDKNDMCSGTSAVSSRLVHGGLRYLEFGEIPLVYESLHERRYLRRIARHLVAPIRITIPIFRGARRGRWLIRLGMIAYDLLSFGKAMPGHDMLNSAALKREEPGIREQGLVGAARYFDAQVTFAERLVLENLLAARAAGAEIRTYCEVREINITAGRVESLRCVDREAGEFRVFADSIVNAAGPWVDEVLKTGAPAAKRLIGGTKGSHIVVGAFSGAPKDAFYVEAAADGRPLFIIPWYGQYLIGTTDIRYDGSLDAITASRDEVDYLVAETNRVFPDANLELSDIHYSYAGVRPLPHREKGPESAITRRHIILVNDEIAEGLISIIGGKLTTYRSLAEQAVDKLFKVLRRKPPECRTQDTDLPGAWGLDRARSRAVAAGLPAACVERLLSLYGGRAAAIVELATHEPSLREAIDDAGTVLAAEVAFVIREEFPRTLADIVFRRTMVGFQADQGRPLYPAMAELAATEFGWTEEQSNSELEALRQYADSLRVT